MTDVIVDDDDDSDAAVPVLRLWSLLPALRYKMMGCVYTGFSIVLALLPGLLVLLR